MGSNQSIGVEVVVRPKDIFRTIVRSAILHQTRSALANSTTKGRGIVGFMLLAWAAFYIESCVHFEARPIEPNKTADAFQNRTLGDSKLAAFLAETPVSSHPWPKTSWDLESLTWAAFFYHPSLEVARSNYRVAIAASKTARAIPNPSVSATVGVSSNAPTGTSPWFPGLSFDIPIETAGKRDYRATIAEQLTKVARLQIASAAWQVRSRVRSAWTDLADASRREAFLQQQAAIQAQIVTGLEQRFTAGYISFSDVRNARLVWKRQTLDIDEVRRQAQQALVALAQAIGVPSAALEHINIDTEWRAPMQKALSSAAIRRQALTSRPDILSALASYAASQSALQLEIAKQYPDLHIGPGYQFDQGEHKWSLGLMIEFPLFNDNEGPIEEAKAQRARAAAEFEALQAEVIGEVEAATTICRNAQARLAAIDDLLEIDKRRYDSMAQQFQAGAADRLEMLGAQADVAADNILRCEAETRARRAFGALEDAVQRPFPNWARVEQGRDAQTNNRTKP